MRRSRSVCFAAITAFALSAALGVQSRTQSFDPGLKGSSAAEKQWPTKDWPTTTAAAVGLDQGVLAGFDKEIAEGKYGFVDNMLVIRCGQIAYDRSYPHDYARIYAGRRWLSRQANHPYNYFNPAWFPSYRHSDLHTMQSVTKSVTSVVIGVARTRGDFPDLDTRILKFFDTRKIANLDDRKRRITVRHLLTMMAGFDWNAEVNYGDPNNTTDRMEGSADWVKFTIDRPMVEEPGTVFKFNDGAVELLAYIFNKATGQDIDQYATKYLFVHSKAGRR
jgi:CubicO group peptidase (beta-lactamase class C family)